MPPFFGHHRSQRHEQHQVRIPGPEDLLELLGEAGQRARCRAAEELQWIQAVRQQQTSWMAYYNANFLYGTSGRPALPKLTFLWSMLPI